MRASRSSPSLVSEIWQATIAFTDRVFTKASLQETKLINYYFSAAIPQPDVASDLMAELNRAETLCLVEKEPYKYLTTIFHAEATWGETFVANEDSLRLLETRGRAELPSVSASQGNVEQLEEQLYANTDTVLRRIDDLRDDVRSLREQSREAEYLRLASEARKVTSQGSCVPFASLKEAEAFLSLSAENSDGAKALAGQNDTLKKSRRRNEDRIAKKQPTKLQAGLLLDFLFTAEAKQELKDIKAFNSLGPATVDFLCDRASFLLLERLPAADIMVKIRHHLRDVTRRGKTQDSGQ